MRAARPMVLLILLVLLCRAASAQGPAPTCPAPHPLPPTDEAEIRHLAEALLADYRTAHIAGWQIVSIDGIDPWGVVSIAPVTTAGEHLPGDADILLAHRETRGWRVLLPTRAEFWAWLAEVPAELLIPFPERSRFALSPGPLAPSNGWYKLPYVCGATAYASRAGADHDNAIDFLIDGVTGGGDLVLAAQEGWIYRIVQDNTACCCSAGYASNSVIVRHPNGEYSYYLHLMPGSVTGQVGDYVAQGQTIAREGDVGYTCSSSGGLCHTRFCDVPGDLDYCCEHLHFEVRDNGNWQGTPLEPQFADVPGTFVQTGHSYTSGNCGGDTTPPETTAALAGTPGEEGWYISPVTVTLSAQDNPGGCGVQATYERLDGGAWLTYTAPFSVGCAGPHTLEYYSVDRCGNAETPDPPVAFRLDLDDPLNPVAIDPGCAARNNGWQGTCSDAAFSWSGARDGTSGVGDYLLYWGTDPAGHPASVVSGTAYDPGPIPQGTPYFLRLTTRDLAGRRSLTSTLYVLRYDATAPVFPAFAIDGGAASTAQVTVWLDLEAADAESGLGAMRFSNDGLEWSPWQGYAPRAVWALAALNQQTHTVYAQVRDRAGNWAQADDDIYLDLAPPPPHGASLRLCASVVDAAGRAGLASPHFRLISAVGQPAAGDGAGSAGAGLRLWAGFLAEMAACRPISATGEAWTRAGIATAAAAAPDGGLPGRAGAPARSAPFRLAGVPAPRQPGPPPPSPSTGPIPSQAERFGLEVNGGYSFTNRAWVTLTLWGPQVTQMQVSNDRGFKGALWQPYRPERPWTIPTGGSCLSPRLVYARFRDATGVVYGDYADDIFYDPVPPWGRAWLVAQGAATMTLGLESWDDCSGVGWMRLAAEEAGLPLAPWETYSPMAVVPRSEAAYVQFRDRAGNVSPPTMAGRHRLYLPLIGDGDG